MKLTYILLSAMLMQFSGAGSSKKKSNLQQFKDNLESAVLSKLSQNMVSQMFNKDGTIKTGSFDMGDFLVDITDVAGEMKIQITDVISGRITSIVVPVK